MATQDCILGMEFSGRNSEGHKVMGLLPAKVIFLSKLLIIMHVFSLVNFYTSRFLIC